MRLIKLLVGRGKRGAGNGGNRNGPKKGRPPEQRRETAPEPTGASAGLSGPRGPGRAGEGRRPGGVNRSQGFQRRQRQIVTVSVGPVGERFLAALLDRCRAASLYHFTGGSPHVSRRRLHLRRDQAPRFLDLIGALEADGGYRLFFRTADIAGRPIRELRKLVEQGEDTPFDLLVVERDLPRKSWPLLLCSRIEIDLWSRVVGQSGTEHFSAKRPNTSLSRVRRPVFNSLDGRNIDRDDPDIYRKRFDIDAVYTWVDDRDAAWQERKETYARRAGQAAGSGRSQERERFRNRDELLYSLRSLEMFAPWVRRVFIVTAGQVPSWLDTAHPKVAVIDHRDIFSNAEWLPTFNSSAIETQLHHIQGLADRFLYFNDDFFLGQTTEPGDFFLSNGMIRSFPGDQRINGENIDDNSDEYLIADKNANDLFMNEFGFLAHDTMNHVPYPCDRQLLAEMEHRFQAAFDLCAQQRFRSRRDLRPIAFMQYHYGYHRGKVVPSAITHRHVALRNQKLRENLANIGETRKFKTFCLNDVILPEDRIKTVDNLVQEFLDDYFPHPSAFERASQRPAGDMQAVAPTASPT